MKAAFLSPYLDVLGGAEKYLFDIAYYLHRSGYQVDFFWRNPNLKELITERFGRQFGFINIKPDWFGTNAWRRLLKTRAYQLFFYVTDGSYFFSLAKRNFVSFHVPNAQLLPAHGLISQWKALFWTPMFNSRFTQNFLLKKWPVKQYYLLHPLTTTRLTAAPKKEKIILSVGRFFRELHSKKQEVLIKAFVRGMRQYALLRQYRLILIGSYKEESREYLHYLEHLCQGHRNIQILTNASHATVQDYFRKAPIYWHAAGYGVNDRQHSELVEHFGTTIVEAMANFAVPIVYRAGGPKEIIVHGKAGYFFRQPKELIETTVALIHNPKHLETMGQVCQTRAVAKFGETSFTHSLQKLIK